MEERGMFPPKIADSASADALVTIWSEDTISESLKLASELRSAGLRAAVYPEADKLGKQLKYADSINVPFACIVGESEVAAGTVTVKNLISGDQQVVRRAEAAASIKQQ
jgi:histidyl-tRNA synthetase